jgi:hypothetical protein
MRFGGARRGMCGPWPSVIEFVMVMAVLTTSQDDAILRAGLVLIYLRASAATAFVGRTVVQAMLQGNRHYLWSMAVLRQRVSPPLTEEHQRTDAKFQTDEEAEYEEGARRIQIGVASVCHQHGVLSSKVRLIGVRTPP